MKKANGFLLIEQLFALSVILLCVTTFTGLFVVSERTLNDVSIDNHMLSVMYQVVNHHKKGGGEMVIDDLTYTWEVKRVGSEWQVVVRNEKIQWKGTEKKIEKERFYTY